MADKPKKPVTRQINIDASDPSKVRDAVLVDAVMLVPQGSGDQTLTIRTSDGALITIRCPKVTAWRYYETGQRGPVYLVDFKHEVGDVFISQAAIDEFDRSLRAAGLTEQQTPNAKTVAP